MWSGPGWEIRFRSSSYNHTRRGLQAGVFSIPARTAPINYPCDASDLLKIKDDGSLTLYGSSTILENKHHIVFRAPWHVWKMCVWIGGEYRFLGMKRVAFEFDCLSVASSAEIPQWIEGPVVLDKSPVEVQCSPSVHYPFALVTGPGQPPSSSLHSLAANTVRSVLYSNWPTTGRTVSNKARTNAFAKSKSVIVCRCETVGPMGFLIRRRRTAVGERDAAGGAEVREVQELAPNPFKSLAPLPGCAASCGPAPATGGKQNIFPRSSAVTL